MLWGLKMLIFAREFGRRMSSFAYCSPRFSAGALGTFLMEREQGQQCPGEQLTLLQLCQGRERQKPVRVQETHVLQGLPKP